MFVSDRAKTRVVSLVLCSFASVQLWPAAYADLDTQATVVNDVEIKAPKKTKRKKGHDQERSNAWQRAAERSEKKEKKDPIEIVIKTARKQLGKPYRWAAVGPNAFDCSGFTGYVWKKAGVTLPRTSSAQRAGTKHIPLDEMKPGDLIFSSGHVGLYIGKGKMIHSPRSGRTVSIDPIHSRAYGAGRPKV